MQLQAERLRRLLHPRGDADVRLRRGRVAGGVIVERPTKRTKMLNFYYFFDASTKEVPVIGVGLL